MSAAAAVVAVGCGSDDTIVPGDAGGDVTLDARPDVAQRDAGPDSKAGDADAQGPDAPLTDADASPPSPDAQALIDYTRSVSRAFCQRFATCCLGPDASAFNMDGDGGCVPQLAAGGGIVGIEQFNPAFEAGASQNVTFDPAQAASCLSAASGVSCLIVTSTEYDNFRNTCFGAIHGTIPIGSGPCRSAVECVAGAYCQPAGGDAATSSCVALAGNGSPCTSDMQCTYLGNPGSGFFCNTVGDDGGPISAPQCTPTRGDDAGCFVDPQCTSGLCTSICSSSAPNADPGVQGGACDSFTIKDAGGGG